MEARVLTSLPSECLHLIAKATARADPVSVFRLAATCSQFRSLEIYIDIEDEDIERAIEMFGDDFDESKVDRDFQPPYLIERFSTWKNISDRGIAFRASQFGFLSEIQESGQFDRWLATEDPFTLLKDLIFLSTKVPSGFEERGGHSEADGEMFPVLLSSVSSPGKTDRPGLLMKTIGIHPNAWGRFEEFPFPMNKDRKLMQNEGAEYGVSSTDPVFRGMVEEFLSVHPNKGYRCKSSGRYLGVCGEVVWT
ncbi:hypothetical protein BDR26DRAFT_851327 [Obelidium mucronatum]|nr:hypothetical protein BDR26DRAFT_851327 [Obelidium mucronatum]